MTPGSGSQQSHPLKWRIVALAALCVVTVVGAVGVGVAMAPPPVKPDLAFADITWAELTPPGSMILETRASRPPPGQNLVGRRIWFGTSDSQDEVKAYYSVLLHGRQNWSPDGSLLGILWSDEVDACTWHNDTLTFRLGLPNMEGWRELRAPDRGSPTVYSIEVFAATSDKVGPAACKTEW